MGTASVPAPSSPPSSSSASSSSSLLWPKRATTYSAAMAISSSDGMPALPLPLPKRPFLPDSASKSASLEAARHSFRISVRSSEFRLVCSRRRCFSLDPALSSSSSSSPPHCLSSCPRRRSGMCWPRPKHEVTDLHFSATICATSVWIPVCSVVFSLTSEKASTIIARRKLSSTMNTSSSNDQKKRVPAKACRPVRARSSVLTPISPSRISKQVSTELPKDEKAWMLLPKMRWAIMA
mmetsp:Transcript_3888/g.11011  ORF Transcript_3888/g.11011 Transcript_3888/m.11011 type:complete len:237 (+) Transcript_3888:523-1233(+)